MKRVATSIRADFAMRMERVLPDAELAGVVENLLEKEVSRREGEAAYQRTLSEARSGNGNGNGDGWDPACGHF